MSSITRAGYNSNTCITWDFNFTYDGFGNTTSIKVGSSIYTTEDDRRVLAEYEYADKDGLLTKQTYGNGDYTSFTYDNLGRKKETKTSSGDTYNYKYTGDGQLYSITDVAGGLTYQYTYDTLGRLMQATRTSTKTANHAQSLQASYTYDTDNRIKKLAYNIPGVDNTFASYYYSSDESSTDVAVGALTKMSMFSKGWINYTYDAQGRLFTRNIADLLNESYAYLTNPNNSTRTTTWISGKTIVAPNGTSLKNFSYEYNNLGYIKTERESWSGIELEYDYDKQGQLLSAKKSVNDTLQKTYTYTYDTCGNIRTATDGTTSHTYTYDDRDWKDLLTAYDGTALTYDDSGNPTSYYNGSSYTMQWRNGRELQSLTKGGKTTSYEYDVDGLRNLKTNADGSYSVYYWLGNLLLAEERHTSTSTRVLVFSYDENNSPVGFQFKTNDGPWYYYLYAKNIQGDIVALYRRDINADGTRSATHIANYEYDPWGKILSIKNAAGQDISNYPDNSANVNPLRYRGYYYDNESGFYYLQSRYYDPTIGRFINADTYASTGQDFVGYNMFAYCNNNPIVGSDPSGKFVLTTFLIIVGASTLIGAGTGAYMAACDGGDSGSILEGTIEGGLTGLAAGAIGYWTAGLSTSIGAVSSTLLGGAAGFVAGTGIDYSVQAGAYAIKHDTLKGFEPDKDRILESGTTTAISAMIPMFDGFSKDIGAAIGTAISNFNASFAIATAVAVHHQVKKKGTSTRRRRMCVS